MTEKRVVVVGGGVIGCSVARTLAPDHDVLVLEQGQVASGATGLSAGLVTMTPSYNDVPAIPEFANEFFRDYDGTGEFQYAERSSVELVPHGREEEARRRVDRLQAAGVDVDFLETDTVTERHPRLATAGFAGGVEFTDTGWVDPYTFAVTLQDDAERRGAKVRSNTCVESIATDGDSVTGVETAERSLSADVVVAATGWRTPQLVSEFGDIPVRPYRTQCLIVDPGTSFAEAPIGWHPDEHVYFRPEHNGDLLIGGWSFAEEDPETASENADEEFRTHVAELLPRLFVDLPDPRVTDGWAGIDGATPDTRPIVDAPGGMGGDGQRASTDRHPELPEDLVVATGFHGRGVMTAPVGGEAVRAMVAGESTRLPLSTFALDRFEAYSPDFEFVSISS